MTSINLILMILTLVVIYKDDVYINSDYITGNNQIPLFPTHIE